MKNLTTREKGPKCEKCTKPVEVGQLIVVTQGLGETHVNCDDPFSLKVSKKDKRSNLVVLLDRPMIHVPLAFINGEPIEHKALEVIDAPPAGDDNVPWHIEPLATAAEVMATGNKFRPAVARFQPRLAT